MITAPTSRKLEAKGGEGKGENEPHKRYCTSVQIKREEERRSSASEKRKEPLDPSGNIPFRRKKRSSQEPSKKPGEQMPNDHTGGPKVKDACRRRKLMEQDSLGSRGDLPNLDILTFHSKTRSENLLVEGLHGEGAHFNGPVVEGPVHWLERN